jgi:hypothetical protein
MTFQAFLSGAAPCLVLRKMLHYAVMPPALLAAGVQEERQSLLE